jgi:hypothetical protein
MSYNKNVSKRYKKEFGGSQKQKPPNTYLKFLGGEKTNDKISVNTSR